MRKLISNGDGAVHTQLLALAAVMLVGASCNVFEARSSDFHCSLASDCDAPRTCISNFCVLPPELIPDADLVGPDAPPPADADPFAPDADPTAPDAAPLPDADPNSPDASTDILTLVRQVVGDGNDAEEILATGNVELQSFDLDLGQDNVKPLIVGIRFTDVVVPQGATIVSASLQFTSDATDPEVTNLSIAAEDIDDAGIFLDESANISLRQKTAASVPWSPVVWGAAGLAGADQRTPNLATLVSSVTGRVGWASGNSLVFLVTGTGQRTAEAYDGAPLLAPELTVEYIAP